MNNIYKIFSSLILAIMMFASCSPDEYSLGNMDVKTGDLVEGIAFKIEHDASNPNIVYLTNLMGSEYTPLWEHPQGRGQEQKVTLKMPFPGIYSVKFGVETRGGVVYGDPVTFTIDNFYADFVNDEMWTLLSGGVGKSKTWIHDDGNYGLAGGEVDYADPSTVVEYNNFTPNWSPGKGHTEDDNIWGSTMTFSLDGGAFVNIHNTTADGSVDESGTFMLDTENHTLTFTDAKIMHTQGWDYKTTNWNSGLKILTLTENQLQVAVFREKISGEDEWWMIWNYVSKEYADNYVPAEEPEPSLPDGWQTDISQTVTTAIKWVLSPDTPFNWANLDGSLMNDWNSLGEYPDWTGFDASIPDTYAKFSLTMDSKDNTVIYIDKEGNEQTGTYTLDAKGIYTFTDIKPDINICSWVNLNTSDDNQWRITAIEKNSKGAVTGMWVGVRDATKPEYMVYHLVPQAGTSTPGEDGSTEINFDNSKIVTGDLEGNGNFRIEIYNEYGSTVSDPPVNPNDFVFDNLTVTFTLSGITLKSGAVGNYDTAISFANADWSAQYWGGGSGDTTVSGNGTYTASCTLTSTNGIVVFVIDVKGLATDVTDLSEVKAAIDKIVIK